MDTQKLHDLIDKVVGKDGPLRTPAYWMRRVLKKLVEYSKDIHESGLMEIAKLKASLSVYFKTPSKFTYDELYELANAGNLVPGQQYILTDYVFTTSLRSSRICAGFYAGTYGKRLLIYLTALDEKTFSSKAKCVNKYVDNSKEWDVDFFFFGCKKYAWNRRTKEVPVFSATSSDGNTKRFTLSSVGVSSVYYTDEDGVEWETIGDDFDIGNNNSPVKYLSSGSIIPLRRRNIDTSYEKFFITSLDEPFRGLIAKAYSNVRNVEVPYDPWVTTPAFQLTLPTGSTLDIGKSDLNPNITNYTLKPCFYDELIYMPKVKIEYRGDLPCYIGYNCDCVYIYSTDNGPYFIGDNSKNIYLPNKNSGKVYISGNCSNISVNTTSLYFTALGKCFNIEFSSVSSTTKPQTYVVLGNSSYLKTDNGYGDPLLFIGLDSAGNIRQWNPADFVDAVEPEEQTTEMT